MWVQKTVEQLLKFKEWFQLYQAVELALLGKFD